MSAGAAAGMNQRAIDAGVQDLQNRTLRQLPGLITKLIYLSSTRDFNTGAYGHMGLALRFGEEVASSALDSCHRAIFREVLLLELQALVQELDRYFSQCGGARSRVLESWSKLQAYRTLIPRDCDVLSAALFASNVKVALAVLRSGRYCPASLGFE
jgi:hypothetical protein